MDRPGAVADLRAAVAAFATEHLGAAESWCVALSGGPDSLALTAAAATTLPTTALIVDHGLQEGSAAVALTVSRLPSVSVRMCRLRPLIFLPAS